MLLATDELYLDYGESFWKIQRERMAEVKVWQQAIMVKAMSFVSSAALTAVPSHSRASTVWNCLESQPFRHRSEH